MSKETEKSILERLEDLSDKTGLPLDSLKRNVYSTSSNKLTPKQKLEFLEEFYNKIIIL